MLRKWRIICRKKESSMFLVMSGATSTVLKVLSWLNRLIWLAVTLADYFAPYMRPEDIVAEIGSGGGKSLLIWFEFVLFTWLCFDLHRGRVACRIAPQVARLDCFDISSEMIKKVTHAFLKNVYSLLNFRPRLRPSHKVSQSVSNSRYSTSANYLVLMARTISFMRSMFFLTVVILCFLCVSFFRYYWFLLSWLGRLAYNLAIYQWVQALFESGWICRDPHCKFGHQAGLGAILEAEEI